MIIFKSTGLSGDLSIIGVTREPCPHRDASQQRTADEPATRDPPTAKHGSVVGWREGEATPRVEGKRMQQHPIDTRPWENPSYPASRLFRFTSKLLALCGCPFSDVTLSTANQCRFHRVAARASCCGGDVECDLFPCSFEAR